MSQAAARKPDSVKRSDPPSVVPIVPNNEMLEFASESDEPRPSTGVAVDDAVPEPAASTSRARGVVIAVAAVALLAAAGAVAWTYSSRGGAAATNGSLRVESDPSGLEVRIDGTPRGRTPLSVALAAGRYNMQLEYEGRTQTIPVSISERAETIHHITWPTQAASAAAPATGALQIQTDPAGATIDVDGVTRGASPLSLTGLTPGEHQVAIRSGQTVVRRTVRVDAGSTASLVVSGAPAAAVSGWMQTTASLPLQIFEDGRLIGSTETSKVMLPVGRHDLEFAADTYGFRSRRTVEIGAGRTTTVTIPLERVPLSVNATPWAEVWIDGNRAGETPMAAVMTSIGPHEIEFRHPELGRKVVPVRISLKEPARVSVDMRAR